jgi:(R)-benzylsuccinyl-CoA dehydrogenase
MTDNTMNFDLPEDVRMIRDVVARFTREKLLPLEQTVIRREAERGFSDTPLLPPDVARKLQDEAKEIGLWGMDVPEEFGGQDLGALAKIVAIEQLKLSIVPFVLPPDSPNLHFLKDCCKGNQVDRYLLPYATGAKKSCLALTEPGAGSDAGAISMKAERRNGKWLLNGTKIFISGAKDADFIITIAVTDPAKKSRGGMTAFLVDKGTPGLTIPASYPMIGEYHPYEVHYENVELDDSHVLGEVGQAFVPLQRRLSIRRAEIAARCLGFARRCISMMIEQANARSTFGSKLADRQTVQFWIADSYQEMEACRLAVYRLASRVDRGDQDIRIDGSMVKIQGPEMVGRVIDRAIQLFGGMGVSKELPLEYMYRVTRAYRIVEGPSEVHRWTIGRDLIRNGLPEVR